MYLISLSLIFNIFEDNPLKVEFTLGIKDILDYNSSNKPENSNGHKLCREILEDLLSVRNSK